MLHDVVLPGLPLPPGGIARCPGCLNEIGTLPEGSLNALDELCTEAAAGDKTPLERHLAESNVAVAHPERCPAKGVHPGVLIHCATSTEARAWYEQVRTVFPDLPELPPLLPRPQTRAPGVPGF
ncbi:hypothetical protein FHS35_002581 [Streptomyces umbrinus]|nr:hypothetical protein [Streptomyces umbrinus]GHH49038.1 hypothetical protein GCM10018775_44070 [Streptomyces umbrinus]